MSEHTKYYILGAFLLGVALTTTYNKNFASLENDDASSKLYLKERQRLISSLGNVNDLDTLKKKISQLESSLAEGTGSVKQGIEGCIGDTPLIRIKSLSEYTGCEIFAKAEVGSPNLFYGCIRLCDKLVPERGR